MTILNLPADFELEYFDHPDELPTLTWHDDRVESIEPLTEDQETRLREALAAHNPGASRLRESIEEIKAAASAAKARGAEESRIPATKLAQWIEQREELRAWIAAGRPEPQPGEYPLSEAESAEYQPPKPQADLFSEWEVKAAGLAAVIRAVLPVERRAIERLRAIDLDAGNALTQLEAARDAGIEEIEELF